MRIAPNVADLVSTETAFGMEPHSIPDTVGSFCARSFRGLRGLCALYPYDYRKGTRIPMEHIPFGDEPRTRREFYRRVRDLPTRVDPPGSGRIVMPATGIRALTMPEEPRHGVAGG